MTPLASVLVASILAGCNRPAPAPEERSQGPDAPPADKGAAVTETTSAAPVPAPSGEAQLEGLVAVGRDAPVYIDAEGSWVPRIFDNDNPSTLGGTADHYYLRVRSTTPTHVEVETIPSVDGRRRACGVGIVGLDPVALRLWVAREDLLPLLAEETELSYEDGSGLLLPAGTPVDMTEQGAQARAGLLRFRLPEAVELTRSVPALGELEGEPIGESLPPDQRLRIDGEVISNLTFLMGEDTMRPYAAKEPTVALRTACAELRVLKVGDDEQLPLRRGDVVGRGGGHGFGYGIDHEPVLRTATLPSGVALYWPNGKAAGTTRSELVLKGELKAGTKLAPRCLPLVGGTLRRLEPLLCPDGAVTIEFEPA